MPSTGVEHVRAAVGAPLAARELPSLFDRVHRALAERRDAIDDLNVFPVPDGDTGTNMTLTVRAGLDALHAARPASPEDLAVAVIRGAVRGARGNSGVIISQVLRAVVEVVTGHPVVDAQLYADALARARDLAYEAVADPVEGTMLTAIAEAAEAARAAVERGEDLVSASAAVCAATSRAVERTRDQLEVLHDAGVVDAGARGFEILLAAVHGHLSGEAPRVRLDAPRVIAERDPASCHAMTGQPFEVQYLLEAPDEVAGPLRRHLEQLGDSVVVVAAGGLLNVHVHTATVGPTIEAGLEHGRPSSIEVTHFGDQRAVLDAAREAARAGGAAAPRRPREPLSADATSRHRPSTSPVPFGAVAVLDGEGLMALARAGGAVVVPGGPGSLPSVADLLTAIEAVPAERVLLLPGHRNALPTARQAAELAASELNRTVEVIDAAVTPPAVLAGLAVLDPHALADRGVADVRAAARGVRSGEVVLAVRDADTRLGRVRRGQPLGVVDGVVVHAGNERLPALQAVVEVVRHRGAELVTLLLGLDATAADRDAVRALVGGWGNTEVEVIDAGCQRVCFWVGVE